MDKNRESKAVENALDDILATDDGVRTLQDLELVLVGGGGDDINPW
jgi:hypothetical protein